ncbi:MAG: hypothetical protein HY700_18855 [Gemmatimonadetes bacterium]|nr:hypothetical protein [Gemmatimonadota bacterium]
MVISLLLALLNPPAIPAVQPRPDAPAARAGRVKADPRCALLIKMRVAKACEVNAEGAPPASSARGVTRTAQSGRSYYPLAYGYPTRGWYNSMGGLSAAVTISALRSFPYRYDQFYRGPRKVWW